MTRRLTERPGGAERGADGETVKIWCVCDSVKGDVESFHPSYAWAMERIDREMDARPILTREAALEQAAEANRCSVAQGAAWDGRWCLVVELGDLLPGTWIAPEFAGPLGVESLIARRAVRLVRPTAAELAQSARVPAVA